MNQDPIGVNGKVDLSCQVEPRMVAEIKIIGADYSPKGRWALESDVDRLGEIKVPEIEKFMSLVVPVSEEKTKPGDHLLSVSFSEHCCEKTYPQFKLRIWKLN